jgi:hypothetical protein
MHMGLYLFQLHRRRIRTHYAAPSLLSPALVRFRLDMVTCSIPAYPLSHAYPLWLHQINQSSTDRPNHVYSSLYKHNRHRVLAISALSLFLRLQILGAQSRIAPSLGSVDLLDTIITNVYASGQSRCHNHNHPRSPMSDLQFHITAQSLPAKSDGRHVITAVFNRSSVLCATPLRLARSSGLISSYNTTHRLAL